MSEGSLTNLPNEVLLQVVEHLECARDVAHVGRVSKGIHELVQHRGWQTFVQKHFSSLSIPPQQNTTWDALANRLTYHDRCWERKGIVWRSCELEQWYTGPRRQNQNYIGTSSVVDARVDSLGNETVAWAAGEDLVVQHRTPPGKDLDTWNVLKSGHAGFPFENSHITALSMIDLDDTIPEVLVGRANGDLQLLSAAQSDFGISRQRLLPPSNAKETLITSQAIRWTEWNSQSHVIACSRGSIGSLYSLGSSEEAEVSPFATFDVARRTDEKEDSALNSIKFLSPDLIVCAVGGSQAPLCHAQIRPTGIELVNNARNLKPLEILSLRTEQPSYDEVTTVRAIEPVGHQSRANLLLSAWDDGTHRLSDIRTPSTHDAVYRDIFKPNDASSCLLVYGTERFIAGSEVVGPDLRFFDFRYPKPYHHTVGMPCSGYSPIPSASGYQSDEEEGDSDVSRCEPCKGKQCTWHAESKSDLYRPDSTFYLSSRSWHKVTSLAKPSDISSAFYCGVHDGVLEGNLSLGEDFEYDWIKLGRGPPDWSTCHGRGKTCFIETGVSLCSSDDWLFADEISSPQIWTWGPWGFMDGREHRMYRNVPSRLDIPYMEMWRCKPERLLRRNDWYYPGSCGFR